MVGHLFGFVIGTFYVLIQGVPRMVTSQTVLIRAILTILMQGCRVRINQNKLELKVGF